MTQQTTDDALRARLIESMPTMAQLCTSHDPTLFRSLLSRVGDKWTLLVIGVLGEERKRFTELSDIIPGISRRMLTVTLRALERDGLVSRTVHAEVPPRVEYQLTALGRSLQTVVLTLGDWVSEHQHTIMGNRQAFDGDALGSADGDSGRTRLHRSEVASGNESPRDSRGLNPGGLSPRPDRGDPKLPRGGFG